MRIRSRLANRRRNEVYVNPHHWPVLTRPSVAEFNPPGDIFFFQQLQILRSDTIHEGTQSARFLELVLLGLPKFPCLPQECPFDIDG